MTACAHSDQQTPFPQVSRHPWASSAGRLPHRARAQLPSPPRVGVLSFLFFFLTFYFAFLFMSPSSLLPLPVLFCFFFSFSPLPNSPQRSQRPCLQNLVLPSPLCPDQDWGDSPLLPGPGLRAVGEILVFNQQKPLAGPKRGAVGPTWISDWGAHGSLPLRCCSCQRLPSGGRPVDSTLCRLPCPVVRSGAASGRPAPFSVRKAVKSQGLGGEEARPRGSRAQDWVSGSP